MIIQSSPPPRVFCVNACPAEVLPCLRCGPSTWRTHTFSLAFQITTCRCWSVSMSVWGNSPPAQAASHQSRTFFPCIMTTYSLPTTEVKYGPSMKTFRVLFYPCWHLQHADPCFLSFHRQSNAGLCPFFSLPFGCSSEQERQGTGSGWSTRFTVIMS